MPPKAPKSGWQRREEPKVPMRAGDLQGSESVTERIDMDPQGWGACIPKGTTTILSADPGAGKTTFLLKSLSSVKGTVAYFSAEESAIRLGERCGRIGASPDIWLLHDTSIFSILAWVKKMEPAVFVIDSINAATGIMAEGESADLKDKLAAINDTCMRSGMSSIVISHVNKEGGVYGPRGLEHMSDANIVIQVTRGGPYDELRTMRATKNRFHATGRYGAFRLLESGLSWTDEDPTRDEVEQMRQKKAKKSSRFDNEGPFE